MRWCSSGRSRTPCREALAQVGNAQLEPFARVAFGLGAFAFGVGRHHQLQAHIHFGVDRTERLRTVNCDRP